MCVCVVSVKSGSQMSCLIARIVVLHCCLGAVGLPFFANIYLYYEQIVEALNAASQWASISPSEPTLVGSERPGCE